MNSALIKIRIFFADHQEIFLDGLKQYFQSLQNIEIVGQCSTDQDLLHEIAKSKPNIVFLDVALPHIQLTSMIHSIRSLDDDILIFVLYSQFNEELLLSMLSAGVNGIAHKYLSKLELETSIYHLLNNQQFFCGFTTKQLQYLIQAKRFHPHVKVCEPIFSDKEKTILQLLASELTSKEIAEQLGMSSRTVESHRKSMQEKTGSKNSTGLILYAIKNGIIPVQEV